jgi:uncharacterized damage-inducible protein DinB
MEITTTSNFLHYYRRIKERTLKVVRLIPAAQLEFRLRPNTFSIGDLARHIILIERDMYIPNILGQKSRYKGCGPDLESILHLYTTTMAKMEETLTEQSVEWLNEKCKTPVGTPIRRWKWLRAMIEHEVHHRGQLYQLLGQVGVSTPPIFQLTSEEVIGWSDK